MNEVELSKKSHHIAYSDGKALAAFSGANYSCNINGVVVKIDNKWRYYGADKIVVAQNTQIEVCLRDKTASVLNLLIDNSRKVVDSACFFNCIWEGRYVSENVLKQSIKELRDCFNDGKKTLIKTMPRRGYCLDAEIEFLSYENTGGSSTSSAQRKSSIVDPPSLKIKRNNEEKLQLRLADKRFFWHLFKCNRLLFYIPRIVNLKSYKKWTVTVCGLTLFAGFSFATNNYFSLKTNHQKELFRVSEQQARIKFHQDVLLRYLSAPKKDSQTLKSIFKKSMGVIDSYPGQDVEKLGMLYALFDLYRLSGFYGEARIVFPRLEKMVVNVFGGHSDELYRLRFLLIDILIKLKQRQEAYNLSRITLDQIKLFHHASKHLLASAYYYSAMGLLYCVAPFCERREVLSEGEDHAREALRLHRLNGSGATDIADTLWLLNWFIWEGDEKIRISEQVLNTYLSEVGELNEKTAAALEQLGRTLTFWKQDWHKGESLLLRALSIRKNLFPSVHPEMARIHSYLGEHYFMTEQFSSAIEHLTTAINITEASLGERGSSLQDRMLLARAELYRGDVEQAARWVALAYDMIERYKLTYSDIVLTALKVTELRVKLAKGETKDLDQVLKNIADVRDDFKSPKFILMHEYHSLRLKYYPTDIGNGYLDSVRKITAGMTPKYRYLYQADLRYLKERAADLCRSQGEAFCYAVEAAFNRQSDDSY